MKKADEFKFVGFYVTLFYFVRFSLFCFDLTSIFARVLHLHAVIFKRAFKYAPLIGKTLPWGSIFQLSHFAYRFDEIADALFCFAGEIAIIADEFALVLCQNGKFLIFGKELRECEAHCVANFFEILNRRNNSARKGIGERRLINARQLG